MAPKKTTKTKSAKAKGAGPGLLQTDDPIIVKPGGSLLVEIDSTSFQQRPHASKWLYRHPSSSQLTWVVIKHRNGTSDPPIRLGPGDWLQICYDQSLCP